MTKRYTLYNRHLPRLGETEPSYSAGHRTFATREEAEAEQNTMRRQNLPFRCAVVEFEAPDDF